MKIKIVCIGKTNFGYIDEGIRLYQNRMIHFVDFELICLPDIKNQKNMPVPDLKKKEGLTILKNITSNDYLCLLDENGQNYASEAFAEYIEKKTEQNIKTMIFLIGGAFGFSQEVYQRADFKLSLSKMTFSHQIVRLIFMEQLYRAYTIIKRIPYHNQ
jgi:23S rRNA (pseudouridine1915-N3)-methyltransferase